MRNAIKKWLGLVVATATAFSLLTACGNEEPTSSDGPVTLTYATWSEDQKSAMQQIADAFHQENPNITIEVQALPWPEFWTKLQVGAEGGTAPDSFWMLADKYQPYADAGMLLDVDQAMKEAGLDTSKYPKAVVDMYTRNGKLWGVPKDYDTNGLWFNKALFDAKGVAYPTDSWTWADVQSAAKKLTDPSKGVYGIAAPINGQSGHYNTILQAGGKILADDKKTAMFDSPESIRGLQFWVDLIKDRSSPSLKQMSDTEPVTMFMQGKVAMYQSGAYWAKRFYDDGAFRPKVGVAPLPQDKTRATVTSGIANAGYAKSKHPEQLKKWLLFLGGQQAAEIQGKTGAVLPAYEGTQKTWVDSMPEFKLALFIEASKYAQPLPVTNNTAAWTPLETQFLVPAWEGKESVESAAKKLNEAVNAKLAEEK